LRRNHQSDDRLHARHAIANTTLFTMSEDFDPRLGLNG
jgi:hypothetical protein